MNISSTQFNRPQVQLNKSQCVSQQQFEQPEMPADSFTFGSDDLKSYAVMGGIALLGGAIGAAAGNYSGVIAGIGGAIAGAAGGTCLGIAADEHIKTGAVLGAVGGAILASSVGHPAAAIGLGLAGATLPYAAIVGVMGGFG